MHIRFIMSLHTIEFTSSLFCSIFGCRFLFLTNYEVLVLKIEMFISDKRQINYQAMLNALVSQAHNGSSQSKLINHWRDSAARTELVLWIFNLHDENLITTLEITETEIPIFSMKMGSVWLKIKTFTVYFFLFGWSKPELLLLWLSKSHQQRYWAIPLKLLSVDTVINLLSILSLIYVFEFLFIRVMKSNF